MKKETKEYIFGLFLICLFITFFGSVVLAGFHFIDINIENSVETYHNKNIQYIITTDVEGEEWITDGKTFLWHPKYVEGYAIKFYSDGTEYNIVRKTIIRKQIK